MQYGPQVVKIWVDPPDGWRYGFPKCVESSTDLVQLLEDSGYPKDRIQFAINHCRFWSNANQLVDGEK